MLMQTNPDIERNIGKSLPFTSWSYWVSDSDVSLCLFSPHAPTAIQCSSIFDYMFLASISAQFHFTIWQLCYLCHLNLSARSISAAANLHVCISLGSFVRKRQSVRTVKEEGISAPRLVFTFNTRAHRSPVRNGISERRFLSELWSGSTAIQRPVHGCVIHSDTHIKRYIYELKPRWLQREITWGYDATQH